MERMKSTADLTAQIQRINKNHGQHRLYKKALELVLFYNHNMSMSETNSKLHQQYMRERDEGVRDQILEQMNTTKYPASVYTQKVK